MLSCKETSELLSRAQDERLSFPERMGLRFHLMMCSLCRGYEKQLRFIRQAAEALSQASAQDDESVSALSAEARERVKEALRQNQE